MDPNLPLFPLAATAYRAGDGGITYDLRPLGRPYLFTVYPPGWKSKGYHSFFWQATNREPVADFVRPDRLLDEVAWPWRELPTEELIRAALDMSPCQLRQKLTAILRARREEAELELKNLRNAEVRAQALDVAIDALAVALEGLRDE